MIFFIKNYFKELRIISCLKFRSAISIKRWFWISLKLDLKKNINRCKSTSEQAIRKPMPGHRISKSNDQLHCLMLLELKVEQQSRKAGVTFWKTTDISSDMSSNSRQHFPCTTFSMLFGINSKALKLYIFVIPFPITSIFAYP